MATEVFKTNFCPANGLRGSAVIVLTIAGILLLIIALHVEESAKFAFPLFGGLGFLFSAFGMHFSCINFAADKHTHRYRYFVSVLGWHLGSWQPLQPVKGVVLKHFSELPIAGRRGWQIENRLSSCIVMLSTAAANQKGIIVHKFPYRQKAQATALAKALAEYFAVPNRDFDVP